MSNKLYQEFWQKAQKDLEDLAVQDYENQALEPTYDKTTAQSAIFELYVKYIIISNRLEEVYDQFVQPQKRILVRKLLDSCLGRVIELKHDLVNIDMMEFNYNDEVMERLRLTPFDVEIKIPRYFRRDRKAEIMKRRKTMDEILQKYGYFNEDVEVENMTEYEAIKTIQMHERARQGRLRFVFNL